MTILDGKHVHLICRPAFPIDIPFPSPLELGRGTATFDGQSLAEAILHQLATHTLPIGFFSTHYHMLTEAYLYPEPHPNVRCQHMQTQVNDEKREVIPMYKLIDGVAESSFGTRECRCPVLPSAEISKEMLNIEACSS
jgi:DNA mismatch repair protein MSH6